MKLHQHKDRQSILLHVWRFYIIEVTYSKLKTIILGEKGEKILFFPSNLSISCFKR